MGTTGRKRPGPGGVRGSGGAGGCGRLSFFCFFSGVLLVVFTLSTLWMHTAGLGELSTGLTPDLSVSRHVCRFAWESCCLTRQ